MRCWDKATWITLLLVTSLTGCGGEDASPTASVDSAPEATGGLSSLFGGPEEAESDAPAAAATLKTGDVVTNSIGMKLGVVPPGEFQMGSPATEEKRSGDEARHVVRLSKPVLMGVYEVTQAEFQGLMEMNPSGITDSDRLPVQNVSWEQAVAFCRKLSELPEEKAAGRIYRLPTEAEWEHACRSGSTTAAAFGSEITSSLANFDGNYPYGTATTGTFIGKPQAVGSYEPNAWGLYDMHGNVWEWCHDWYAADYYSAPTVADPQGPETGISHVIRGGSWYNFGYVLRSAYRSEFTPPLEANIYGFRVVASLGTADTFEPSELDSPNPTPMPPTSTPAPPAVAATPPAMETPMMAPASGSPSMTDSEPLAGSSSASVDPGTLVDHAESLRLDPVEQSAVPSSGDSAAGQIILLPVCLLVLASLIDPQRLHQARHYDVLALALIAIVSVLPQSMVQWSMLWMAGLALAGRLMLSVRQAAYPRAVAPRVSERGLMGLVAAAFLVSSLLYASTAPGGAGLLALVTCVVRGGVAGALFLIGQRWKNRTVGLAVALIWLVLPVESPPIAAALLLWAFVVLNRAPLAGVLVGAAVATNWWLCCLIPLWVSFYRGKARSRFLTTAATCGTGGFLLLTVLPGLHQIRDAGSVLSTGESADFIVSTFAVALLTCAAAASWFRPTQKSESTLTAMVTLLLLCVFLCSRVPSAMSIALPWLLLSLTGGCASRGTVVMSDGLVFPLWRRLMSHVRKDIPSQVANATGK